MKIIRIATIAVTGVTLLLAACAPQPAATLISDPEPAAPPAASQPAEPEPAPPFIAPEPAAPAAVSPAAEPAPMAPVSTAPEPAPTTPALPSPPAALVEVSIRTGEYIPRTITVPLGTTVVWTNLSDDVHTVYSSSELFDESALNPGDSVTYTFAAEGPYTYYCQFHPGETGQVIVEPGK